MADDNILHFPAMKYRSSRDYQIAEFLESKKINFKYESLVVIRDNQNLLRLWYPDFFLPDFNIHIEYYGREKENDYSESNKRADYKESIYRKNNISTIAILPKHMDNKNEEWKTIIVERLKPLVNQNKEKYNSLEDLL